MSAFGPGKEKGFFSSSSSSSSSSSLYMKLSETMS